MIDSIQRQTQNNLKAVLGLHRIQQPCRNLDCKFINYPDEPSKHKHMQTQSIPKKSERRRFLLT